MYKYLGVEPWTMISLLKKEGSRMTRIAACSDGKELIVGSDTMLTNSMTNEKYEGHKLFYNKSGVVVAAVGLVGIQGAIESALEKGEIKDIISELKIKLLNFYRLFGIEGYYTQIVVFWPNQYGFSAFPFEVGYPSSHKNLGGDIRIIQIFGEFTDEKYWTINNRALLTGEGTNDKVSVFEMKYDEKFVEKDIKSAINDESLKNVGGRYEYVKVKLDGTIETNIGE